ncbi:MAG: PilZ domain-containing protein [Legionella sp.]|nr:PilZ domain-containing protein [Legionella sp.]
MRDRALLSCQFLDKEALYMAYMPFVKDGGLFIKTAHQYSLETTVTLAIGIWDETPTFYLKGKIIWVTPEGAQDNKPAGVGVQFLGEESHLLTKKIETTLADMLNCNHITHTF